MTRKQILLVLAWVIGSAHAANFVLEYDGSPLSGGEICLFDAVSLEDPLKRLTTFSKVVCHPADEDVKLPRGTFNLFARHPDGYVSVELLRVRDGSVEQDRRIVKLVKATGLRFAVPSEDKATAAVYVEASGVVLPLVPGEQAILVPAGSTVYPLFMNSGVVEQIGPPLVVDSAAQESVRPPPRSEGREDIVIGLEPDRAAFTAIDARKRAPGLVELAGESTAASIGSENRLTVAFRGSPALALFRGVQSTTGVLRARVTGEGWQTDEITLTGTRATSPLRIAPTTTLTVRWSAGEDLAVLADIVEKGPDCPRRDEQRQAGTEPLTQPTAGLQLTLYRCAGLQPAFDDRSVRLQDCVSMASARLDSSQRFGTTTLEGIPLGLYLLRMVFGPLRAISKTVEVRTADDTAEIELQYDRWFGRVTRQGKPVHAVVGIGPGAVTNPETGEFLTVAPRRRRTAPVAGTPKGWTSPISVSGCSEKLSYRFIPDEDPVPNTPLEIVIPANVVKVRVIDAQTAEAIPKANVTLGAMMPEGKDAAHFGGPAGVTDEQGSVAIQEVPPNRELLICASRQDYHNRCSDRFQMNSTRERALTITLERARVLHGKVHHPGIAYGQVVWFRPDGTIAEMVPVQPDGTFTYKKEHAAGEIVSVLSRTTPLLVFLQPILGEDQAFEIHYPAAPVRSFEVMLSPNLSERRGHLSITIGDLVVPGNVFGWHMSRRGLQSSFSGGGTVQARDILATGPISFVFAPMSWVRVHWNEDVDIFYFPAARALPRIPAAADSRVMIE